MLAGGFNVQPYADDVRHTLLVLVWELLFVLKGAVSPLGCVCFLVLYLWVI